MSREPFVLEQSFAIARVENFQEIGLGVELTQPFALEKGTQVMLKDRALSNCIHARLR